MLGSGEAIYLIDAQTIERFSASQDEYDTFLRSEVGKIRAAGNMGAASRLISAAARSLRVAVEPIGSTSPELAKLLLLEADHRLSLATKEQVEEAFDLAENAIYIAAKHRGSGDISVDVIGEAALVAAVCLKALGMRDESMTYLSTALREYKLDEFTGVPLLRQAVMMTEDMNQHLRLLAGADAYRLSRPKDYYRTLKRVFEALVREQRMRTADALLPELVRSFGQCQHQLSLSARVSFIKNLGQYVGCKGETHRSKRLLDVALVASAAYGLRGQERQIREMLRELSEGQRPASGTFMTF